MSGKLRIKIKGIEIEWEGEVAFLRDELPGLIERIVEAVREMPEPAAEPASEDRPEDASASPMQTTTSALAAALRPNSGPELFKVALAKLHLSDGLSTAGRKQILAEMKSVSSVFKPTFDNNFGNIVKGLLGSRDLNEPTKGHYALTQAALAAIAQQAR